MPFVALPGFRDVYPDALARRRRILGVWRDVAERYGFEEYDGPPLEPLELFTGKSGDEIVEQLYTFEDKGGRRVALRPEMTPTLARMVAARAAGLRKPIRWFSMPQLFRYERQQRGRLREHFQLNVDIIGEAGPAADAEVIAVALDIMRALHFGPSDVRMRLSDRRPVAGALLRLGVQRDRVPSVLAALDKLERDRAKAERSLGEALDDDPKLVDAVWYFVDSLRRPDNELRRAAEAEALNECVDRLSEMGLADFVDVDFRVVRGLAYYTGIVFELYDAQQELRAICGGGRYDELLGQIGTSGMPCVGFGMGDVVLGELIAERDGPPAAGATVDVFVVTVGDDDRPAALRLAHALRDRGVRVEYALRKQAVGRQLELAAARGAGHAVIIGSAERERGEAMVRDLVRKTETRVKLEELEKSHAFTR